VDAVVRAILVTTSHLLARKTTYQKPGTECCERRHGKRVRQHAIQTPERQGFRVILESAAYGRRPVDGVLRPSAARRTPVPQYHFNGDWLSALAGVTWWNVYLRLFSGAVRSPQAAVLLVREFGAARRGRLMLEYLPG
jgi:hypothetical protein